MALRCVRLALAALLGIAVLLGQDFRATVTGQITDPSGGGVGNAKVTIQNLQTNESVSQTTNEEGNYTIPFLMPGNYKVTVEAPGFQTTVRPTVEVHTNDKLTVSIRLEL